MQWPDFNISYTELAHDFIHAGGIALSAFLYKMRNSKAPLFYIIINTTNAMNYLKKNWPHISASLGALITAAYQIYSTKQITAVDVTLILTALGLISTTNSGTTTPPAAKS